MPCEHFLLYEEERHHPVMARNAFERNDVKYNRAARTVKLQSSVRPVYNLRQLLFMSLFFRKEAISNNNFPAHVKVHIQRVNPLPFMLKSFHIITQPDL